MGGEEVNEVVEELVGRRRAPLQTKEDNDDRDDKREEGESG